MHVSTRKTIFIAIPLGIAATILGCFGFAAAAQDKSKVDSSREGAAPDFCSNGLVPSAICKQKEGARPYGINVNYIYMPSDRNPLCRGVPTMRNECMVHVTVVYADGVKRTSFGVYVGNDLVSTDYEVVTGYGDHYAVKVGDGTRYTVELDDGTARSASPWAIVPGVTAILQMQ